MPSRDDLSIVTLNRDDAATATEIIAMGVVEHGTTMGELGWIYLHQNSSYDNWKEYEVYIGAQTHCVRAESARRVQGWCAKKFVVGAHYAITLVIRTEILDGEVTFAEKQPFLR